jgi:hypothetical protein
MRKILVLCVSVAIIFSSAALAKKPRTIKPKIDFSEGSYSTQPFKASGYIGVGIVSVEREQPAHSGELIEVDQNFASSQIGWIKDFKHFDREYLVVLKSNSVVSQARGAVE